MVERRWANVTNNAWDWARLSERVSSESLSLADSLHRWCLQKQSEPLLAIHKSVDGYFSSCIQIISGIRGGMSPPESRPSSAE